MQQRLNLLFTGLSLAFQINTSLRNLLLGHLGMEDSTIDTHSIDQILLSFQMLKSIEHELKTHIQSFQPQFLIKTVLKQAFGFIPPALEKMKREYKQFGSGGFEAVGALQAMNYIIRSPISPLKLVILKFCSDFTTIKNILKENEKEELLYE